jgi:hypothetical protein
MDKTNNSSKRKRRREGCHQMMKIYMTMNLRLRKLKDLRELTIFLKENLMEEHKLHLQRPRQIKELKI